MCVTSTDKCTTTYKYLCYCLILGIFSCLALPHPRDLLLLGVAALWYGGGRAADKGRGQRPAPSLPPFSVPGTGRHFDIDTRVTVCLYRNIVGFYILKYTVS